jgi:4-hydroxy-3-methylbut-2-enyl diphosphate reductase
LLQESTVNASPSTPRLEVIVAAGAGTCFGVEMAIAMAQRVQKPILGPLVHNPVVVEELAAQGIPIYDRGEDLDRLGQDGVREVVITAHGYPKELKESLTQRGIVYHDATCPVLLKWLYRKLAAFEQEGEHVILIGNPNHAEIIASRSYGQHISVVYSEAEIDALPDGLQQCVAVCQTTITSEKLQRLTDYLRRTKCPDLRIVDTRCKPVKNQQAAVEQMARWVDAMLIIGGFDSSNTTNLARIARQWLPERTYHIDKPSGLDPVWLDGVRTVGIGAGTSTPKSQIRLLKERLVEVYPGEVVFREGQEASCDALDPEDEPTTPAG